MARNASRTRPAARPARRRESGARTARTSLRDRLESWRLHHRDSALDALRRLRRTPAATAMTVLVIAIALALPVGLGIMLENVRDLTAGWGSSAHLSVFLDRKVDAAQQHRLAADWTAWEAVARTETITPEQALAEYKALSGFGDVLDALPENPLPAVIVVWPRSGEPAALEALEARLARQPGVEFVQLDVEWVRRLHAMIALAGRLVSALAVALTAGVVLVVVNTIRLAIENRRDEIVVMKMVGGTDGFVRRPFLYTGFWYGLGGGLLAVTLIWLVFWWIRAPLDQLLALYHSDFSIAGLPLQSALMLPLVAGLLGLSGAWLAVGRHLRDIEPNV